MVQAGYAERVLRTFGMWDYNPVLTPMDPNVSLTKRDSPEVVDPRLHRRMRRIVGCLSYLVNMTQPDLAFTYSQLSKFVQSSGPVHLTAAERSLTYLRGTYNEGITYCDPGEDRRNKLTGWVDSDFSADPNTRKSMTGYLFSLNGGAVQVRGVVLDKAVSLSASMKPNLWQRHRRVKNPSICERYCGVSISDKSAPLKYGRIMRLVS